MEFEWDEEKDAANRAKHGVGLELAARMDWIGGKTERDDRIDYGEERYRLCQSIWNATVTSACSLCATVEFG